MPGPVVMGQANKLDLMSYELETKFYDHTHLATRSKILPLNRNSTVLSRSIFDHFVGVLGSILWNTIPKTIKDVPSFEVFKSKPASHLMSNIPDLHELVPGYMTPNLNSIHDWNTSSLQHVVRGWEEEG